MESLGSKITEHRKKLNLTQKELGDKLNVSAQAVSKWENGQAEPDASTLIKLCEIFKISTDELLGITPPADETAAAAEATAEAVEEAPEPQAAQPTVVVEQKIINGYCERCKKPVGPGEYIVKRSGRGGVFQHIYCKECSKLMQSAQSKAEYSKQVKRNIISVIVGALAGVAVFLLLWFSLQSPTDTVWETEPLTKGEIIAASVVGGVGYFAFIMQVFWGGAVIDVFLFFLKSFKLPGVIFTLDLDGIIFLILFKVIGAILCVLLSLLLLIVGLTLMPVISLAILPFASVKRAIETKSLKKTVEDI